MIETNKKGEETQNSQSLLKRLNNIKTKNIRFRQPKFKQWTWRSGHVLLFQLILTLFVKKNWYNSQSYNMNYQHKKAFMLITMIRICATLKTDILAHRKIMKSSREESIRSSNNSLSLSSSSSSKLQLSVVSWYILAKSVAWTQI